MSDYKQFWEARNKTEMYLKVVGADHEDPDDVALTVQLFTKGIPWCGTALEIGSGYGRLVKAMAPYFDNVCGVDISHSLLTRAAEYLKDVPNGWSFKTDGQSLPLQALTQLITFIPAFAFSTCRHWRSFAKTLLRSFECSSRVVDAEFKRSKASP
jgi:SAM-dependent methyltransferase